MLANHQPPAQGQKEERKYKGRLPPNRCETETQLCDLPMQVAITSYRMEASQAVITVIMALSCSVLSLNPYLYYTSQSGTVMPSRSRTRYYLSLISGLCSCRATQDRLDSIYSAQRIFEQSHAALKKIEGMYSPASARTCCYRRHASSK